MPELSLAPVAEVARRGMNSARTGIAWWLHELVGMVPIKVRGFIAGHRDLVFIRMPLDGRGLEFEVTTGETIPLSDNGSVRLLAPSLRERVSASGGCVLMLPAAMVLRRSVELPLAAAAEFMGAVAFLVERHTPFMVEQVRYTARLLHRDRKRKVALIEMAVVSRTVLEPALAMLKACDLPITAVYVEDDDGMPPLDLLGQRDRGVGHHHFWRHEPWKLVLAASVALLLAGPPIAAAVVHARTEALNDEVAKAAVAGCKGAALQAEIDRLASAAAFLPARVRGPFAIQVFAELTRLLPDDTWIFALEMEPDEVRIAGFSDNVATVLKKLESALVFEKPELRAPVVHGTNGRSDRFEIAVHIKQAAP